MLLDVRMRAIRAAIGLRAIGPNPSPARAANTPALVALGVKISTRAYRICYTYMYLEHDSSFRSQNAAIP